MIQRKIVALALTSLSALALAAFVGSRSASAGVPGGADLYVSGVLHSPIGPVTLTQTGGRKIRACCLGSTGKDGVEVHFRSVAGGGVSIDPGAMPPGSSFSVASVGTSGSPECVITMHRDISDEMQMEIDASGIACDSLRCVITDDTGGVVSDTTTVGAFRVVNLSEGGAICETCGPCPGGGLPGWILTKKFHNPPILVNGQWILWEYDWVYGCNGGNTSTQRGIRVYAQFDSPPAPTELTSMQITSGTNPIIDTFDTTMFLHGVAVHGIGNAHIDEVCDSPIGCDTSTAALGVSNIGSSGKDGVSFNLCPGWVGEGPEQMCVVVQRAACCRGHVTVLKLHDTGGNEQSVTQTALGDASGSVEIDADFSAIGATGFHLDLFDENGNPIGPVGGSDHVAGGPRPIMVGRCPPGSREVWDNIGTTGNPVWEFVGCLGPAWDFTLPGGTTVLDVAKFRITPLNPTSTYGGLLRCDVMRTEEPLVIESIMVAPPVCGGDANGDRVVNFDDITSVLANWGANYAPLSGEGDANHNTVVNFDDITEVLANWGTAC